jgi:hypothetical protein
MSCFLSLTSNAYESLIEPTFAASSLCEELMTPNAAIAAATAAATKPAMLTRLVTMTSSRYQIE